MLRMRLLLTVLLLLHLCGCQLSQYWLRTERRNAEPVLSPGITAGELVAWLNGRTEGLSSWRSNDVRVQVRMPGLPLPQKLTGSLACSAPRSFRLVAQNLAGLADFGSNDDFCWAYARRHGGKYILRVEDTDLERSTQASVQAILDGLSWLGIDHDEGPFFQMQRLARYREVADRLVAEGHAYPCWATKEELDAMREAQRARGEKPRYDGRWRDRTPGPAEDGKPFVVRLKAEQQGETIVHDVVQGTVRWSNEQLDDMVLLRSDGTPTYMLAVEIGRAHV